MSAKAFCRIVSRVASAFFIKDTAWYFIKGSETLVFTQVWNAIVHRIAATNRYTNAARRPIPVSPRNQPFFVGRYEKVLPDAFLNSEKKSVKLNGLHYPIDMPM